MSSADTQQHTSWAKFDRIFNLHTYFDRAFGFAFTTPLVAFGENVARQIGPRRHPLRIDGKKRLPTEVFRKKSVAQLGAGARFQTAIETQYKIKQNGLGDDRLVQLQKTNLCWQPAPNRRDETSRKSAGGFALLAFITIAPVLIALLTVVMNLSWHIREYTRRETLCENHLFYFSTLLAEKMNELQKLNNEARTLRKKLLAAKKRLAAAMLSGNATKIAMVEAQILQIELARVELSTKQKHLFLAVENIKGERLFAIRTAFKNEIHKTQVDLIELQVMADVPSDIAPVYIEKPNFRNLQTQKMILAKRPLCAVTIEARGPRYKPVLVKAAG